MKAETTSGAAPDSFSSHRDSANLDLLRSAAVLVVLFVHLYDIQTQDGAKWGISWRLGQLGVLIFFVHTCLVLMWSQERSASKQALRNTTFFTSFYVRRALRIYPLSIALVVFAAFCDARWSPPSLWPSFTLTQYFLPHSERFFPPSVTPLWTLPLEMEMYLALPALFLIFKDRPFQQLAAAWSLSVAGACLEPWLEPRTGHLFLIFLYAPCFLGGVVAWRLIRFKSRQRLPGWLWPLAIAAISILWMGASTDKNRPLFLSLFGIGLGLAIPLFQEIPWRAVRSVSRVIARYSYGIYLTHFPIAVYVMSGRDPGHPRFRHLPPMPVLTHHVRLIHTLLVLLLTAFASFALYHAIEEPGIRLGRRLAQCLYRRRGESGNPGESPGKRSDDVGIVAAEDGA